MEALMRYLLRLLHSELSGALSPLMPVMDWWKVWRRLSENFLNVARGFLHLALRVHGPSPALKESSRSSAFPDSR
jgi:hypothetical protein